MVRGHTVTDVLSPHACLMQSYAFVLKLSLQLNSLKFFQADKHISWFS
jgi:hypothetical protein